MVSSDLEVLIADHVCAVDNLTTSDETVLSMKSQRAFGALNEVGGCNVRDPDTLTSTTRVKGTSKYRGLLLSLSKCKQLVVMDTREMVEFRALWFATLQ